MHKSLDCILDVQKVLGRIIKSLSKTFEFNKVEHNISVSWPDTLPVHNLHIPS